MTDVAKGNTPVGWWRQLGKQSSRKRIFNFIQTFALNLSRRRLSLVIYLRKYAVVLSSDLHYIVA